MARPRSRPLKNPYTWEKPGGTPIPEGVTLRAKPHEQRCTKTVGGGRCVRRVRHRGLCVFGPETGREARIVVEISAALHRQLKYRALERDTTLKAYVLALLEKEGLK